MLLLCFLRVVCRVCEMCCFLVLVLVRVNVGLVGCVESIYVMVSIWGMVDD